MLMWHRQLHLIDHGAALYFHHAWDETICERSRDPFARIRDHVLLPFASALQEAHESMLERLTPRGHPLSRRADPGRAARRRSGVRHARRVSRRVRALLAAPARTRRTISSRRPCVPTPSSYDYAIVRVVPRVEREEFINAGVILSCPAQDFLGARIELDERRLLALDAERRPRSRARESREHSAGVRGRRRRRARSASCRRASAFTGWSRRAARSSRLRRFTPVAARIRRRRSIIWCRRW